MEFRILGPLEAVRADVSVPLGGPRHRRLLAALLLHVDEVVSADRLVDVLWGEHPPREANAVLHVRISELRKALGNGGPKGHAGLETRGSGYALCLDGNQLDARRMETLAAAGREALRHGDPGSARTRLQEALSAWRGRPFGEMADEPFAETEVARLEELHLQALEDYWEAELSLGAAGEAVAELGSLVAEYPLRERFWRQLMLAQYRCGRQAEALETYQRVRDLLIERLGVEPGRELQEMQAAVLRQDADLTGPVAPAARAQPPGALPLRLSSFIGREAELADVRRSLEQARLVTVVGAGGVGKSSLAMEAGAQVAAGFPEGAGLVELAAVSQPGLVANGVADILRVREQPGRPLLDVLVDTLRTSRMLLVFDNCEHLVAEVAGVVEHLLQYCPQLSILITSRERLGIAGEVTIPLEGLSLPRSSDPAEIASADASRLLVERATSVRPGLTLDDVGAAAVAQICRRLDGLPLAIELAAARVSALELSQIASRLDDRFHLLTGGQRTALQRHRTLQAVIDWSYTLLDSGETAVFDAAAVFAGGFTLEAAESVCADLAGSEGSVAEVLIRLVDRSLVVSDTTADGRRYRMLETLRVYALDRLREHGGEDDVRRRHSAYFMSLAEPAAAALRGAEQPIWLRRLETEHGNLRHALAWALDLGATETAARLVVSLYPFWDLHGHYSEGRRWIDRVLASGGDLPDALHARVLMGSGTLAFIQGDLETAGASCQEAAVLSEKSGDAAGLAHAQHFLAFGTLVLGEQEEAEALLVECLRNARLAGDTWVEAWALLTTAVLALSRGDYDQADKTAAEGEAAMGPAGDPECRAWLHLLSGGARWYGGDHRGAIAPLQAALELFRQLGGLWGMAVVLLMAGHVASERDNLWSSRLLAASEHLRTSIGVALIPVLGEWLELSARRAQAALGADGFARAWAEGEELTVEDAVDLAVRTLELAASEGRG